MARMARLVVPGYPHHVTQRGNRRQPVFFGDGDYQYYIDLLAESAKETDVAIWAYCLMPNHVHVVAVPKTEEGLAQCFGDAHRRYTRHVNFREGWRGYLWQGRFHSYVMDENYLLATVRYVELNPVRANLCVNAVDWEWSSARAHMEGYSDGLVDVAPMLERMDNWLGYLDEPTERKKMSEIRWHTSTGRPLGSNQFLDNIELQTGRVVRKQKPGPKAVDRR